MGPGTQWRRPLASSHLFLKDFVMDDLNTSKTLRQTVYEQRLLHQNGRPRSSQSGVMICIKPGMNMFEIRNLH